MAKIGEKKLYERSEELKRIERELKDRGYKMIGGIDEAGRGPLAGPVFAACLVLPDDFKGLGIDDSKKLTPKKREKLYDEIMGEALAAGVASSDNREIDEINILEATKLAMMRAVEKADSILKGKGLDPIDFLLVDSVQLKSTDKKVLSFNKADRLSLSVAAASIVAKVSRDRLMIEYDTIYPGYSFASNKGYGTKAHYKGLKSLGLTPIHRKTFLKNLDEH